MLKRASGIQAVLSRGVRPVVTAGVGLLPTEARACSVCIGWTEGLGLNGGFYWSALLLMALPFLVVAVVGAWVWFAVWRARPPRVPGRAEPGLPQRH
ncbi:MAG: hypothetical protein HY724_13155 [Candidatus Rokubacteria bacterium]|nr:hypothetical protein [Candidatus Rokubacteria bacterium]